MTMSSLKLLREEKSLVVYPILSGICCLLVMISFAVPFIANPDLLGFAAAEEEAARLGQEAELQLPLWFYPVLFLFYLCTYFVVIYFNSALIGAALLRFNGQDVTWRDGIAVANARLPQIFAWALVSATVGFLLKMIESMNEKVGQFVASLLGMGWSIITYFVVPVLVVEKVGPYEAVQRSLALLKKAWGEALVGQFSIGLILTLFMLPAIALFLIGMSLIAKSAVLGSVLMILAAIYFLAWSAIGPALHGIFLAALYQYATTGQTPSGFEQQTLAAAFTSKGI